MFDAALRHRTQAPNNTNIALAREGLEAELTSVSCYIVAIRSRLNLLSPINRLPEELLCEIFQCLVPDMEPDAYNFLCDMREHHIEGVISIIHVTHVCRRWRQIALAQGSLWSRLWLENPRWRNEMLARSKSASLTLIQPPTQRGHWEHTLRVVWPFLTNMSRVQYLHLDVAPKDVKRLLEGALSEPAPLLEVFDLWLRASDSELASLFSIHPGDAYIQFPADPFSNCAPRLRALFIHGWIVLDRLLTSPIIRNLYSLRLSSERTDLEGIPVDDVLLALAQMPRLETLALDHVLQHKDSNSAETFKAPVEVLHLPNLTDLDIGSHTTSSADLARRITVSPSATLHYMVSWESDEAEQCDITHFIPYLTLPNPRLPFITMKSLYISAEEGLSGKTPTVVCSTGELSATAPYALAYTQGTAFFIQLALFDPDDSDNNYAMISAICERLSLRYVRDLFVCEQVSTDSSELEFWRHWLPIFQNVERLFFPDGNSSTVLPMIAGYSYNAETTMHGAGTLFLPRLSAIHLHCWTFDEGPLPTSYLESFRRLSSRNGPARLKELHIVECEITAEQVASLKGIVETVQWDGRTIVSPTL